MKNSIRAKNLSSTKRGLKEGFDRVTFIVNDEWIYKLNCIASMEDVFLKEIVNEAFSNYISTWEGKHGRIKRLKK
jgi:hypothetical protein